MVSKMRVAILLFLSAVLFSCSAAKPGPEVFDAAERAIQAAERAGAEEFAPVELRFAREKLAEARRGIEQRKYDVALFLVEESEINSELAIEQSRAAQSRRKVNELRRSNEMLREELMASDGDAFE
jgi:Asp-tRNA(Asn)/Glu-tRNA(Gln) amidotransferase A subunit family amidase